MASDSTGWPNGLTDQEAVERLETLMLIACEGNKDLSNGREYKTLRRALLSRVDLADVVPRYIRTQRDLAAFWTYIKHHSPQWEPRRQHVRETFSPLADRVEGRTQAPTTSTKWTGRRTASQQAQVVIALGYDALAGIDALLFEQERGLHNGGPVESERADAIARLKQLHQEIGELLSLAEADQPLAEKLARIRTLKDTVLAWTASPAGFAIGALPLTGAATALGVGVAALVSAMARGVDATTVGVAVAGVHVAAAGIQSQRHGRSQGA